MDEPFLSSLDRLADPMIPQEPMEKHSVQAKRVSESKNQEQNAEGLSLLLTPSFDAIPNPPTTDTTNKRLSMSSSRKSLKRSSINGKLMESSMNLCL